ncbi:MULTISPECIES: ABC transporter permease [unclassified Ensifer]|uniref:ABC transporter permease n=1 Tax=unclassified Ensifer TaxID=2633371 RepID=UPI000812FE9F|nr:MULTISPECIES: ABC transporter permease [unclassified Ensifer]OCP19930.1 ABC transporter permease [Ensifer sp. LC54]OCP21114.1 ABC transporter permease [Ensifer sp. LC384]
MKTLFPYLTKPLVLVGGVLALGWLLVAILAPLIAPYDPLQTLQPLTKPMTVGAKGEFFLFGTDMLGRDIFSRLVWGARTVVIYSTLATLTAYAFGLIFGLVAGYAGGRTDAVLSFLANVVLSFPVLVLYIVIIVVIGASPVNIVIAVTFSSAPAIFRIVRGITIDIASRDFVKAAITQGESTWRILLVDILPNTTGPLSVDFCLRLGYTAITIGTLGFLGLGLPPPTPDWGGMVNEGRSMAIAFPHLVIFPCIAISSLTLGLSLLADGLREVNDAKERQA